MNEKDNAAKAKAVDSLLNFETVSWKGALSCFVYTVIYFHFQNISSFVQIICHEFVVVTFKREIECWLHLLQVKYYSGEDFEVERLDLAIQDYQV